jgi:hypothetical protein
MMNRQKVKEKLFAFGRKAKSLFKERENPRMMNIWQAAVSQFVFSFLLYFVIEWMSRGSFTETISFLHNSTKVFCYNALFIFVTSTPALLFRKRSFFQVLIFGIWFCLGLANGIILANRVTPFTGPDFKNITEGSAVLTKYMNGFEIFLMVLGIIAAIVYLVLHFFRTPKYKGKMHRIPVLICVAASFFGFYGLTRYCINNGILATYFGNIAFAYEDYGFPYCFTVTVVDTGISEPDNYSQELIDNIITNDSTTEETSLDQGTKPNIIVVQLESFFDPTRVSYLNFSEDPIPNWHALCEEYSNGFYTVPTVGAGTANTEFETLTGMSLHFFGAGEYPFKSILKEETCESSAYVLRDIGYNAFAIHDNEANFYSRRTVYKNLGFESFTSAEYMQGQDDTNYNGWMRDENLITPINDCLDSTLGADYVFTVTVQPHGSYPTEQVLDDPEITVTGAETTEENYEWEYYINELHEEDQFIADLIASLEERDEPTVLLLYGDHLPTMGLEDGDLTSGNTYQTNYLIWDNIGLEKQDMDLYAYQSIAEVMNRLNIHEGTMFRFQQANMGGTDDNFLANMQALQYDILYGERYCYHDDGDTPYTVYPFYKLGVKTIDVTGFKELSEGMYYIYGDNFTQSCKVYIDGEAADTTWISQNILLVQDVTVNDWSVIQVGVQSNSSTHKILSWTLEYQKEPEPTASPTASASATPSASTVTEDQEDGS